MIFVRTPLTFYILRFLLGAAEAGFIPGVLLYLTYWYPADRRGRINAIFLAAIPAAGIFGGPLSGWILKAVSGTYGLAGWQWLFLVETVPSLVLGVVTLLYLDNRVASASWLDADEKRVIAGNIEREEKDKEAHSHLSAAFKTGRVWLLGLIYFCIVSGLYIVGFWLPTLIKQAGVSDPLRIGLLTALPNVMAIIAMIAVCGNADRLRERRWHTLIPCVATGIGLALTAAVGTHIVVAMIGLTLAAAGSATAIAAFWGLPAAFLGGAAAAAGIALVNSLGNIAGFVSTFVVGWMTDLTHSTAAALYLFAGIIIAGGLLVLTIPGRLVNK